MEDTHITTAELTKDQSLFAVFDGHGGSNVSEYAKDRFSDNFDQLNNWLMEESKLPSRERSIVIRDFLR